jgi:rRNA processing protein Gar1
MHPCDDLIVLKSTNKDEVPFFNAPIFLENKEQVGKVDEIFGPIKDCVCLYLKAVSFINIYLIKILVFFC